MRAHTHVKKRNNPQTFFAYTNFRCMFIYFIFARINKRNPHNKNNDINIYDALHFRETHLCTFVWHGHKCRTKNPFNKNVKVSIAELLLLLLAHCVHAGLLVYLICKLYMCMRSSAHMCVFAALLHFHKIYSSSAY